MHCAHAKTSVSIIGIPKQFPRILLSHRHKLNPWNKLVTNLYLNRTIFFKKLGYEMMKYQCHGNGNMKRSIT